MIKSENSESFNQITTNDDGIIEMTIKGRQTRETIRHLGTRLQDEVKKIKARGEKVYIITDISGMSARQSTSGSRQEARKLLSNIPFDRSAVYGKGSLIGFIMYLTKVTGTNEKIHFFTDKRRAHRWLLQGNRTTKAMRPPTGLVVGVLLILIGASTLLGWQLDNAYLMGWSDSFRPMNPVSAVGIVIMGIGFISYWTGKLQTLRVAGVGGIALGLAALSPWSIDNLLYSDKILAIGTHTEIADSAAICFIAMGIGALIAGHAFRGLWIFEVFLVAIVGSLAALNIFGQMYARDWIYDLGSTFVMAYNLAFAFIIAAVAFTFLIIYRRWKVSVLMQVSKIGWLIVIVLALVQAATYAAWSESISSTQRVSTAAFESQAKAVEDVLKDRFTVYINALYGFQGLFLASTDVSRGDFLAYHSTTNVEENYPGLRTLSFISKVESADLNAFIQKQRNDTSVSPLGNPSFNISQRSSFKDHYIVTYLTSMSVPGSDLGTNPSRLKAFQQAEATGKPVASGTIEFAATATTPAQNGFFITLPISYRANPNAVVGFVNAVFNYDNFFKDTFKESVSLKNLNVRMIDTLDNKTVFNIRNIDNTTIDYRRTIPIAVADRTWNLEVDAPKNFGVSGTALPQAILVGGQAFSLLLIIIFWIQARGRRRALDLADDITKDLQEERNLAVANDQKSKAILTSIGDGVFVVDTNGIILVLNPVAQAISGVSEAEAIGRPYTDVLRFEFEKNEKVNNAFIKKALSGHMASMANHTSIVRSDGKRIPVADSAAPIRDASDNVVGAIVVFRDVSKEYELDKAKTEFVSLASHQLRTPLSAINWYSEMLLSGDAGKINKNQHEYIQEIFEGSQRMSELVNSLLNVSRLEVGKLTDLPTPTDLPTIIKSLEKELKVSINDKGLHIHTKLEDIKPVIADPKQLRMIIQNLVSNAVKYTPENGTVTITLRKATSDDLTGANMMSKQPHWYFSVQDDGYGIPVDQQPKIFGKLFRADNVRKLDVEGTGLGLYIVKQVVGKMGGRVWFKSTESLGTTFYVIAPITPEHKK